MIKATLLLVLLLAASSSQAQLKWSETFPYGTSGDLVDGFNDWLQYNSGSLNVQLGSGGITHPSLSYVHNGSGNHIILNGDGQSVIRLFNAVTSGTVYFSFLIDVSAAPSGEVELLAFETNAPSGENYAILNIKSGSTNNVQFALEKNNVVGTLSSFTGDIPEGIHLLVLGYEFVPGGSDGNYNDICKLWIDPDLSGAEDTPDITWNDNIATEAGNLGAIVFYTPSGVSMQVAGLRVATAWSDAPLPVQLTNLAATSSRFGVDLKWSTASEINNYGFEIERRSVGSDVAEWSVVGFVQGAGTSNGTRDYYFADSNVDPGRYAYRIKQIDMNGAYTYYSAAEVEVGLGPKELALEPNYPNPFNPSTNITFTVPVDGRAALKVYNMLGQEVAVLFDEEAVAGRVYQKTFDASSLPTGVYVSRLEFGGQSVMRKMLFVK